MSTSKINMIGIKYGHLLVLREIEKRNRNGHIMYEVICECGNKKEVLGSSMRSGSTKSCGCLAIKVNSIHSKSGDYVYKI